jgi:hypothetical protein
VRLLRNGSLVLRQTRTRTDECEPSEILIHRAESQGFDHFIESAVSTMKRVAVQGQISAPVPSEEVTLMMERFGDGLSESTMRGQSRKSWCPPVGRTR